jgi:hypothetical protein
VTTALWGARRPGQLKPVDEVSGWQLDAEIKREIDRILETTIIDPVGPQFMAPPARKSRSSAQVIAFSGTHLPDMGEAAWLSSLSTPLVSTLAAGGRRPAP